MAMRGLIPGNQLFIATTLPRIQGNTLLLDTNLPRTRSGTLRFEPGTDTYLFNKKLPENQTAFLSLNNQYS
jgi:hypothetical protein